MLKKLLGLDKTDYQRGYKAGYGKGRSDGIKQKKKQGRWVYRNGNWYCSECNTKLEQAHDYFCCFCGAEMDREEAD